MIPNNQSYSDSTSRMQVHFEDYHKHMLPQKHAGLKNRVPRSCSVSCVICNEYSPPRDGEEVDVCGSVNRYAYVVIPWRAVTCASCRRNEVNVRSPSIADACLYTGSKPNVSFPVPNGDPRAGTLGYNSRIPLITELCSDADTREGEVPMKSNPCTWAEELMVAGMKEVPGTYVRRTS